MTEESRKSSRKFTEVVSNPRKQSRSKSIQKNQTQPESLVSIASNEAKVDRKINESVPNDKDTVGQIDPDPQQTLNQNQKDEANQKDEKNKSKRGGILKKDNPEVHDKLKKGHNMIKSKSLANQQKNHSKSVAPAQKQNDKKAIKTKIERNINTNHTITRNMKRSDPNYNSDVVVIQKNQPKARKDQPKVDVMKNIRKVSKEPVSKPELNTRLRKLNQKEVIIETEKINPSLDKKANPKKKMKRE